MTERDPVPPGTPPSTGAGATAYPSSEYASAHTSPQYSDAPVAFRGPESLGGLLLILAGVAAAISLLLDWLAADDVSGWGLVRRGFDDLGKIFETGMWQPLAVVLGGGVLFLLGLLAFWPARSHRLIGVLALFVSLAVAAGIVVRVADLGWDPLRTDPGVLCAVVLAGAGTLGALKAMLTPPEFDAPLTSTMVPVEKRASGDDSHTTAEATSSGRATRPNGD
jgi:hypothetical protein